MLGMLFAVGCGGEVDDPGGKGDGIGVGASSGTGSGGKAGSGGGGAGTSGSGGRGGSSSGASGGAPAAGGATGRGGSYGVGGVGGAGAIGGVGGAGAIGGVGGIACDPDGTQHGIPGDCVPVDPGDACQECVQASCCTEWASCIATSADNVCAWGGPNGEGEIICFQICVQSVVADGGVADDETMAECAANCATPGCTTIGSRTNDMIACLSMNCLSQCFMP
jgi:hypothetical protein